MLILYTVFCFIPLCNNQVACVALVWKNKGKNRVRCSAPMQFLSYLINGISLGSVYALIALGYTMVYGIAKMLNFAHGDVSHDWQLCDLFRIRLVQGLTPLCRCCCPWWCAPFWALPWSVWPIAPCAKPRVPGCSDHSHRRFLPAAAGGPAAVDFQPQELQVRCQPAAH